MWRRSSKNASGLTSILTCHMKSSFLSLPQVGWLSTIITTYIPLRFMILIKKLIKVNMKGLKDLKRARKNSFLRW